MIAARLHAVGDLRVADEPPPGEPPPGWSLARGHLGGHLRVRPALVHRRWHRGEPHRAPVVPGHEFAAVALTGPHRRAPGGGRPRHPVPDVRDVPAGLRQPLPHGPIRRPRHARWRDAGAARLAGPPAASAARRRQRRRRRVCSSHSASPSTRSGVSHLRPGADVLVVGGRTHRGAGRPGGASHGVPRGCSSSNPSSTGGTPRCAVAPTPRSRPSTAPMRSSTRPAAAASTWSSRSPETTPRSPRPSRPAGPVPALRWRDPVGGPVVVPRRRGPAQGPDVRDGAADERHLSARHRAGRRRRSTWTCWSPGVTRWSTARRLSPRPPSVWRQGHGECSQLTDWHRPGVAAMMGKSCGWI